MSGPQPGPGVPAKRTPEASTYPFAVGPSAEQLVVINGDNQGIVNVGDNAFNVIYAQGGFVEVDNVMELPLVELPPLPASPVSPLFGRDALVEEVVDQLSAGRGVQSYGVPDIGKKTVAATVHRRLAAAGGRGHVLLPRAGQAQSLETLYTRLASLFFGRNLLRGVDESVLRARGAAIRAHVTLADCTLGREDLVRLWETFPGCTFLLTSPFRTVPETAAAFHVQPLSHAAAIALLSAGLGQADGPVGLQNPQFDHVYRMSEGRPQRLHLFAEYIRNSDAWSAKNADEPFALPPLSEPGTVTPQQQAEALAVALTEPARSLLVALATFATPIAPAWCGAVAGEHRWGPERRPNSKTATWSSRTTTEQSPSARMPLPRSASWDGNPPVPLWRPRASSRCSPDPAAPPPPPSRRRCPLCCSPSHKHWMRHESGPPSYGS